MKYTVIYDDTLKNILYNADGEALKEALKIVLEYHESGERPKGHNGGLAQFIANDLINSEKRAKDENRKEYQREWDRQNRPKTTIPTIPTFSDNSDTPKEEKEKNQKKKEELNTNTTTNTTTNTKNNALTREVVAVEEIEEYFSERGWEDVAGEFWDICNNRGWENITSWKSYAQKIAPRLKIKLERELEEVKKEFGGNNK